MHLKTGVRYHILAWAEARQQKKNKEYPHISISCCNIQIILLPQVEEKVEVSRHHFGSLYLQ